MPQGPPTPPSRQGAAAAALLLMVLNLPFLWVPFWQDDFGFLYHAAAGDLWERFVATAGAGVFYRPASIPAYWAITGIFLGGHPVGAHLLSLLLFGTVVFLAGMLGERIWSAAAVKGLAPRREGSFFAGLLFGGSAAFFLPLAWASASQETIALIWALLALHCWVASLQEESWRARSAAMAFSLAAFASKEGMIVLPALFAVLALLLGHSPRSWAPGAGLAAAAAVLWLAVRGAMAAPPEEGSTYALQLGANVMRNGIALGAFSLNVPREALRLVVEERSFSAAAGAGAIALASAAALLPLVLATGRAFGKRTWLLAGWWLAALCPYFLLRWNCYAYYVLLGLVPLVVLGAAVPRIGRIGKSAAAIWVAAGITSLVWSRHAPYPAPVARAQAIHPTASALRAMRADVPQGLVLIDATGAEKDLATLGWTRGLALHLGISQDRVALVDGVQETGRVFVHLRGLVEETPDEF